jgi:hypothetical protein
MNLFSHRARLFFAFVLLTAIIAGNQIQVTEFRELDSDFTAEATPQTDLDGNYCFVLRLDGDFPADIQPEQKVYHRKKAPDNGLYFYLSAKESKVVLAADTFSPLTLTPPDGHSFTYGKVYYARLKTVIGEKSPDQLQIMITTKPEKAVVNLNGEMLGLSPQTAAIAPGTYALKLTLEGYENYADLITVGSDTKKVFRYTLTPVTPMVPKQAAGQNDKPVTSPGGDVVIADDFSDGDLGNWIKVWGEWGESGGELHQIKDRQNPFILTGNDQIDNYSIEVKAKKSSGNNGFAVVLGAKLDNKTAIVWSFGYDRNRTSILMSDLKQYATQYHARHLLKQSQSTLSLEDNKWYNIKAVIEGSRVRGYLNGNLILDYSGPEIGMLTNGRIGLGSIDAKVSFDNLKVTRLP